MEKNNPTKTTFWIFAVLGAIAALVNTGTLIDAIFGGLILGGIAVAVHKGVIGFKEKSKEGGTN